MDSVVWKGESQEFKAGVLLPTPSLNQMDIEQVQELQRKQSQSCTLAKTRNNVISKSVLPLGIRVQIGMNNFISTIDCIIRAV